MKELRNLQWGSGSPMGKVSYFFNQFASMDKTTRLSNLVPQTAEDFCISLNK